LLFEHLLALRGVIRICKNRILFNLWEYEVIWGHLDILLVAVRRLSTLGGGRTEASCTFYAQFMHCQRPASAHAWDRI